MACGVAPGDMWRTGSCCEPKVQAGRADLSQTPQIVKVHFRLEWKSLIRRAYYQKVCVRFDLIVIDYLSNFPVLIPLGQVDAETVAKKVFRHWIALFGAPASIHSDQGRNFDSQLFRAQCDLFGIRK